MEQFVSVISAGITVNSGRISAYRCSISNLSIPDLMVDDYGISATCLLFHELNNFRVVNVFDFLRVVVEFCSEQGGFLLSQAERMDI